MSDKLHTIDWRAGLGVSPIRASRIADRKGPVSHRGAHILLYIRAKHWKELVIWGRYSWKLTFSIWRIIIDLQTFC